MARKKSYKKNKKIQPAVRTMAFSVPTGNSYVDLSQCASLLNRRFYRQGINWVVAGFRVFTPTPTAGGGVSIGRLPDSWSMANGWQKSFALWNRQQMEAVEAAGAESAVSAFRDFKIHADPTHVTAGFANNLTPVDFAGNAIALANKGEWEASEIVLPNETGQIPKEVFLHGVGVNNHFVSRGIIEGYADSRAFPQSPDPVSPVINDGQNWMAYMFDTGNDISPILENATDRNDNLPYDQVNYPGGETQLPDLQFVDGAFFSLGSNPNKLYLKGDNFPCGLVKIVQNTPENLSLLIDLVPGTHKGYLCQPMQDM